MPFDGISTAIYQVGSSEEQRVFADAFTGHLVSPFALNRPLAITAYGVPRVGKTSFCQRAVRPVVGEKATKSMLSSGISWGIRSGSVLRHRDFGPKLIRHEYDPTVMEMYLMRECGIAPRANTGRVGIDWMEHSTIPHLARADIILMFGRQSGQDSPDYYRYFSEGMKAALSHAPENSGPPSRLRQKLHNICPMRASLIEHIRWDERLTHLMLDTVVPQMEKMVSITSTQATETDSEQGTSNIISVTVVPHAPDMHLAAVDFHRSVSRYAL